MAKKSKGLSVSRMTVSWTMYCAGCALFLLVWAVVGNALGGGLPLNVEMGTLAAAMILSGQAAFRGRGQLRAISRWLFLVPAVVPLACAGIFLMGSIEHGFESRANFVSMGVLVAIGLAPMAWWALLRGQAPDLEREPGPVQPGARNSPWG